MSNYEMKHLHEVRFIEIKNICLALGIDSDLFETSFFDWFKSSPLSGSTALDMCKTRLLAGLSMPWEKEKDLTTDGWTNIEDVLPFKYGRYLVYAPGIDADNPLIYISLFSPSKDPGWENQTWGWSHWMPLPEPPSTPKDTGK